MGELSATLKLKNESGRRAVDHTRTFLSSDLFGGLDLIHVCVE